MTEHPAPVSYQQPQARPTYTGGGASSGGAGAAGRVLLTILVTLFLVATPLVATYVSYKLTVHEGLWPISLR